MVILFVWLVGWLFVWTVYILCGLGIIYFWRMGEVLQFFGCIGGCIITMIIILSIGV